MSFRLFVYLSILSLEFPGCLCLSSLSSNFISLSFSITINDLPLTALGCDLPKVFIHFTIMTMSCHPQPIILHFMYFS